MATRGKNYSERELKQLCNSVLYVSQDPCIGNGQRAEKFWERVTQHYEKTKPAEAEVGVRKSLEGKWSDIKHDVAKFIGVYKQVEGLQISGTNEDDTIMRAKELYKQNHPKGKPFTFESCFWILKDCCHWGNPADEMAGKNGTKTSSRSRSDEGDLIPNSPPTPVVNVEDEPEVAQSGNEPDEGGVADIRKRPIGNKRAKEDAKRQKAEHDFMKESLRVQGVMASATIARNDFNQGKGTLLKLLQIPTANLAPHVQEIVARWTLAEADLIEKKLDEVDVIARTARQQQPPTEPQFQQASVEAVVQQPREATHAEIFNGPTVHSIGRQHPMSGTFAIPQEIPHGRDMEFNGPNVYVPDTLDPGQFMAEFGRQFQGRP